MILKCVWDGSACGDTRARCWYSAYVTCTIELHWPLRCMHWTLERERFWMPLWLHCSVPMYCRLVSAESKDDLAQSFVFWLRATQPQTRIYRELYHDGRNKSQTKHFKKDLRLQRQLKHLISSSRKGINYAFCRVCRTDVSISHGGRNDLEIHIRTAKHKTNEKNEPSSSQKISRFFRKASNEDFRALMHFRTGPEPDGIYKALTMHGQPQTRQCVILRRTYAISSSSGPGAKVH